MELLYVGIIIAVVVVAVVIGALAFTGAGDFNNPINPENFAKILRPTSPPSP